MKKRLMPIWGLMVLSMSLCAQLLNLPESVEHDPYNNRYLVSNWGNGNIVEIDSTGTQSIWLNNVQCFAGLHRIDSILYVACREYGVKGFNLFTGENVLNVNIPGATNINDITADNFGNLYVSYPEGNVVYKVNIASGQFWVFADNDLDFPNGMYFEEENNRLLLVSFRMNSTIQQISLADSTVSLITNPGLHNLDGITRGNDGDYYVSSWYTNSVYKFDATFQNPPEVFSTHYGDPADIFFDKINNLLAVPLFFTHQVEFVNGPVTNLKFGVPVNIDGTITNSEWGDADSIEIYNPTTQPIKIYYKHDGTNFLAAFILHNIEVNEYKIPEVLFDTHNDKSTSWLLDDWWFHISAQDCEGQGEYDVWNDCSIVQPDWFGIPNFGFGTAPPIDTIELLIPWEKLNLQTGDTIGFAFNFWISDELRLYWPNNATIESPATWGTVIISENIISSNFNQTKNNDKFVIHPNPFYKTVTIEYMLLKKSEVNISITDSSGKLVKNLINTKQQNGEYDIIWDGTNNSGQVVPSGIYYCNIQAGTINQTIRIIKTNNQ